MKLKESEYREIVLARKNCRICPGLKNPADVAGGQFDCDEIGAWSRWQGNLDADVILVGQDWGDVDHFIKFRGTDPMTGRTNKMLMHLLSYIGRPIKPINEMSNDRGEIFLTNAILCLKDGGMQAPVVPSWFQTCATKFLRRQIEIISPKVVIGLGQRAFDAVLFSFGLDRVVFRVAVDSQRGIPLPSGSELFAVYHCSPRILNTHRNFQQQLMDWQRIRNVIEKQSDV
jgi:DNA polymerase